MYISRTNRIQQYLSGRIFKSRFWSGAVCLCVIAALMVSMAPLSQAAAPSLKTKSAILIDAETGQVLYEKNADMRLAPASMTKIMTMLLAMEAVEAEKQVLMIGSSRVPPGASRSVPDLADGRRGNEIRGYDESG